MAKIFEKNSSARVQMSGFDLSHEKKLSFKMGQLVPCFVEEVLPGDQFKVQSEVMLRFAPMLAPIMHRVDVYMHYFFVPNRLVWNEWEAFITGGPQGETLPVFPTAALSEVVTFSPPGPTGTSDGSLADYLGLPTFGLGEINFDPQVSLLPFRAYASIWNEYYRDQNLINPVQIDVLDANLINLKYRAWEKDYFTSALPWPQRGPAVGIPANINYLDVSEVFTSAGASPLGGVPLATSATDNAPGRNLQTGGVDSRIENIDPTDPLGVTINDLRTANRLQQWLERQARGGARYIETLLSHFKVRSSDARLQRPEYLGGGRQRVAISEVLNNTGTVDAPQGDMAGHGISVGQTNSFKKRFEEHGYVMGIMSVIPRTAYQQGIHRHWSRTDKLDYFWPEFAHLGEQAIQQKELYYNQLVNNDEGVFGYQQRYAEYKYGCSTVHGAFRNNLDFWHMGRIFDADPLLNENFVSSNPTDRIFAVQDESDHLWCQVYHNFKARRPIPYFSDPRL